MPSRRSRRAAARWAWVPLGLAAGVYAAAPRVLSRVFAPPQPDAVGSPGDLGLPEEQVWLESVNRTRLHGWFIPVGTRAPAVVVLHGWGGNSALMLPLAGHLHRAGFHALFLDARNHGLSEHDRFTSMPRFAEDLDVAVRWLRDHPAVTSVGAIGHSVGAGAAILSASRADRIDALVSVAAPAHPGELMRAQMKGLAAPVVTLVLASVQRVIGHRFEDFAPRHRVSLVRAPLMLVHGDADDVVPIESLHELAASQPKAEVLVVPGAGHSDLGALEDHVPEIMEFFERHLRPGAGTAP